MKIEIISNINMDSLKFYLKNHTILQNSCYGNYLIDLLDENSSLYLSDSEVVICFLDIDVLNEQISEIKNALIKLKKTNKVIIINTLSSFPFYIDTYTNNTIFNENTLNNEIISFAKENSFIVLDFSSIVKRLGMNHIYDFKYWYIGKIKYTAEAFEQIAFEIDKLLNKYPKSPKKCIVFDLDNTLWGGVVGEENITLSNEGKGAIYQDFQRNIKKLKNLGILLAINSKNNYSDAIKGLTHNASILKPDDFIIIKANWENKNTNIQLIAKELNISEDSLVFIDDNPVEREFVQATTKACVPSFPENIYYLNEWFIKDVVYKYFYKFWVTQEDLDKHTQYKANIKRNEISQQMDYNDFLKSLNIKLTFYINEPQHIQRYTQLTQKTNQFNLTTKRYTEQDIQRYISDKNTNVISVEYEDKFAKEGIIGLAIVKLINNKAYIDTLLLSCRVLKRGVENALLDKIISLLPKNIELYGEFYQTDKNEIAKDVYKNLGFVQINDSLFKKDI